MTDSILIIGSGGREHALAWKLSQSSNIKQIFVTPGNAGTNSVKNISNCNVNIKNHEEVAKWCKDNNIALVVVGPEDPLANGLSDHLTSAGIKCFGPCKKAAQIEASKEFAKYFMDRYQIPTARWKSFKNAEEAKDHILNASYDALVIKASGLAAGKGVIVASNKDEAMKAVDTLKQDKGLSVASDVIVIEELLSGEEVSVLCFSDGITVSVMPPAQDHKRLLDGDKGPNTGGMGAYCKCPLVSEDTLNYIKLNILQKTIDGMRESGTPYVGVLYAGLMLTKDGPKVLEFNCRFGDPETQVILPLLKTDLYGIMTSCVSGTLSNIETHWSNNKQAVGVVLVSQGYPGSYPKGKVITGFEELGSNYLIFHAGTSISSDQIVTSGGRVLAVVAVEDCLEKAALTALKGSQAINFEGKFYRNDIAGKALQKSQPEGMTYKSSGVDIDSADDLVKKIKTLTKQTVRPEVCGGIGGFGGIFELSGYNDPYLVSKVASLGEKLKIAQECFKYELAGYDLVASAVNEIICCGAEPLFFLDTYTCGKLNIEVAAQVISGIVKGCKESNCTLIGGETAEMPGMYADGKFDLTAFARGAVEKSHLLPQKEKICEGDIVIGLQSSSLNCNSYKIINNLIKKLNLVYKNLAPFDFRYTLEETLLCPTKIHVQTILPLLKKNCIKAAANPNKHGLTKSVDHILSQNHSVVLDSTKWTIPPIFNWVATNTNFPDQKMIENFNLGLDLLLIVDKKLSNEVLSNLESFGEEAAIVGVVGKRLEGEGKVKILHHCFQQNPNVIQKKKIAILSGEKGYNMNALIGYFNNPINLSDATISLVISETDCENLKDAKGFDIPTEVVDHKKFNSTLEIDMAIDKILKSYNIEVICLDGFRKEFSREFLSLWKGKIINIHSSILPAFDCPNECKEASSLGVRIAGCTVHLLEEEKYFGKIIEQDAINLEFHDTEETLYEKIQHLQQFTYPKAVELFISGKRIGNVTTTGICKSSGKSDETKLNEQITSIMRSTTRPGFGKELSCGIFDLKASGYQSPYLVSGTDGVGTKLKIAQACDKHDTIGIDLVAMCVNDILTHGAEPLLFMQSFDCGSLDPQIALSAISGIAEGCKQANCALVGSELNELPDIYFNEEQCIQNFNNYDVVGYAEGALNKENILPLVNDIKEDDVVIGIASSGVHSNGYSLIRKLVDVKNYSYQDPFPLNNSVTLGEVLLTPTKIYVRSVLPLMKHKYIKAAAHITGGGLTENIPRVLPETLKVVLFGDKWDMPLVLQWIAKEGRLSEKEMLKTFNCGIGMALIADKKYEKEILKSLKDSGETASTIGCVKILNTGDEQVEVKNFKSHCISQPSTKKRVGVLISGSGTNLQALIDSTQNPSNCSSAEIVVVISNVPDVEGLKRAERAGIPTKVLSHKGYKKRVEFDMAVHSLLTECNVEIVCLAGFMRILSKEFVQLWQGKLLNVHPALLPSFKGVNAHKQALEAGVKITGCTVHFVEPEVDAGAIIEQASVKIEENDNEKILQEKVKVLEHMIFPKALELLSSGKISRNADGKLQRQS